MHTCGKPGSVSYCIKVSIYMLYLNYIIISQKTEIPIQYWPLLYCNKIQQVCTKIHACEQGFLKKSDIDKANKSF